MRERARRPLAHDEMRLNTRSVQHLQDAHAEDRPSRASNTDNEPLRFHSLHSSDAIFHETLLLSQGAPLTSARKNSVCKRREKLSCDNFRHNNLVDSRYSNK